MANKLNRPSQPVAQLPRNGFDMSQMTKFTSTVGQLLPVYYDFLNNGDEISFQCSLFTRTKDLEKAAVVGVREHIDLFFVPMNQLCSLFEDWVSNTNSFNSSLLHQHYLENSDHDSYFYPRLFAQDVSYLFNAIIPDWDDIATYSDYDYLNYKNSLISKCDEFGVPHIFNIYRLADLLGQGSVINNYFYHSQEDFEDFSSNRSLHAIFLPFFQAYQKIFFDYYADETRTERKPQAFNVDLMFGRQDYFNDTITYTDENNLLELVRLRYRPWKKDFFTSISHSPLMNNDEPNTFGINLTQVNNWLGADASLLKFDYATSDLPVGADLSLLQTSISDSNTPNLNSANLRSVFAVDNLLRRMQRSKKTWDYENLALFGNRPDLGVNGRVFYLGSHTQQLQIGEVVATATTDGSTLGQIGGKGASYDTSSKIKFKAPCRGILMAIYSAVPEADYNNRGLDRLNTFTYPWDFWNPEFDKLGEQPVFDYQLNFDGDSMTNSKAGYVRGWHPRYMEFKQKYDRACGDYLYTLKNWTASKNPMPFGLDRTFANWHDLQEKNFYIDPCYLDQIFLIGYQLSDEDFIKPETAFRRDPLHHVLDVSCFKSSPMSLFGVESL